MRPHARLCCISLCLLALSGCSQLNIPNPFDNSSATPTDANAVYISQFPDISIPVDMKSVPKSTLVTPAPDGTKSGLETFEGRVDAASLANAMLHNMSRQGWSLRGAVSGKNTMQMYEKDQRFVVLYLYDQTLTTSMEVWVFNRLAEAGAASFKPVTTPPSAPKAAATPSQGVPAPASKAVEKFEGGVGAKPLSQ